jgi:hypothetical protein
MTQSNQSRVQIAPVFALWRVSDRRRQSTGRISTVWNDVIQSDRDLKQVSMVIDLQLGGIRGGFSAKISAQQVNIVTSEGGEGSPPWATMPGAITSQSPKALLVEEPEIVNEYAFGEATSSARSIALTINPEFIDPATLIQQGLFLAGFAEVSLVFDNCLWEDRYVIIRGDIAGGVAFGGRRSDGKFSTLDFEVVDPRETAASSLPPWVITSARMAISQPQLAGERFSIIANSFKKAPTLRKSNSVTGHNTFIVCQGILSEFEVEQVWVNGAHKGPTDADYPWSAVQKQDNFGTDYIEIQFTSPVTTEWADGDTVYARVSEQVNRSLTETIYRILSLYTAFGIVGLNPDLFSSADAKISLSNSSPQVLINGSGSGNGATAVSYIESTYLASFPMVSMIWEKGGYGPIVTDYRSEPISEFIAGQYPLYDRASLVQESAKEKIVNEFILRWNYDAMLDLYTSVETRTAENSSLCAYSQEVFGYHAAETIESVTISTEEQANYVLDWMVSHLSLPSYYIEYEASPSTFLLFRRGDTIKLSDDEFGWERQSATIERITYRSGKAVVGLRVWVRFVDYGGSAYSVGGGGTVLLTPSG